MSTGNHKAAEDQIWVCGACGKTSRYKYGFDDRGMRCDHSGARYASVGWDESCMMNSVLCHAPRVGEEPWQAVVEQEGTEP